VTLWPASDREEKLHQVVDELSELDADRTLAARAASA
jgi:hypothetical protein